MALLSNSFKVCTGFLEMNQSFVKIEYNFENIVFFMLIFQNSVLILSILTFLRENMVRTLHQANGMTEGVGFAANFC